MNVKMYSPKGSEVIVAPHKVSSMESRGFTKTKPQAKAAPANAGKGDSK